MRRYMYVHVRMFIHVYILYYIYSYVDICMYVTECVHGVAMISRGMYIGIYDICNT